MKIKYEFIKKKVFFKFFYNAAKDIYKHDFNFDIKKVLSENEKEQRRNNWSKLKKRNRYQLVAKHKNQIVGWSFGFQMSGGEFYMINSAVLPEYRRLGIYTKLLKKARKKIIKMGFQRIISYHKMTNNPVIIAKLKQNFLITGFMVNDVFGSIVQLTYYTNKKRRKLLEVRVGSRKIDNNILSLMT